MMLKTGIHLLFFSTIDFFYVYADFAFSNNPALKWTCLAGLFLSLACFAYTYIRAATSAGRPLRHMVRFAVWKASSTH